MQDSAIFAPFLALMLLTFVVWVHLYVRRIGYLRRHRVNPRRLTSAHKSSDLLPEEISYPADNLRNLFELPVLFYALCLYLYASGNVDSLYVIAAWLFVGLRSLHSAIQCTVNIVMARFAAYMAGAVVFWLMLGRALLDYL